MDLAIRCTKDVAIRDYFHISILGYGGEPGKVWPVLRGELAAKEICTISEIANNPYRLERRRRVVFDGANVNEMETTIPVWMEPVVGSDAPMCKALRRAHMLVSEWIRNGHVEAFPPIVFNLTDGTATDGDPRLPARNLTRLATRWGSVFLFNCCLSYVGGCSVLYPEKASDIADEYGKVLFEMSSRLPSVIRRSVQGSGLSIGPDARGFAFQATFADLFSFLDIGTRPAPLR